MKLLNERMEDRFLIREYSRNGVDVSHTIKQLIEEQTEEETIVLPKDPIVELKEKQVLMQAALDELLLSGGGF